ncbi:UbiA family prenyltransferase [Pedobacter sp. SYSU D00535]|uniref:UbiA family prenyltransferase n=1 Tax=Pedobacter sp. SYSU D00535 TaxID=2810308 RepID=UPI001A96F47F|nr:UbiA family prenyltransferase [Pedobacter sp. SYSU D00535]
MPDPRSFSIQKTIRQTLDFLLFSNVFIALCAVAQACVTYHLLDARCDEYVLALLFCSTLALYNFSAIMSKPAKPEQSLFRRVKWVFSHYRMIITLTLIAVLSIIPLVLFVSTASKVLLFFLAVTAVTYNLPIFSINDKKFGLRNVPGLKLFLIALIWSLSCVLLPILEIGQQEDFNVSVNNTILLIAKRFLFIAAITVPFDIRDLYQDKRYELKTIPVILGEKKAYYFCQLLLGAYVTLLFAFTQEFDAYFFALTLTIVLTGWLIFKSEFKKNEYYYFLLLDGTMILQFILVYLASLVSPL